MRNEFVQRIISSILIAPLSFFVILKGSILFNFFIISPFKSNNKFKLLRMYYKNINSLFKLNL